MEQPLLDCGGDAAWAAAPSESGPQAERIWQPSEFLEEVWPKAVAAMQRAAGEEPAAAGGEAEGERMKVCLPRQRRRQHPAWHHRRLRVVRLAHRRPVL